MISPDPRAANPVAAAMANRVAAVMLRSMMVCCRSGSLPTRGPVTDRPALLTRAPTPASSRSSASSFRLSSRLVRSALITSTLTP